MTAEERPADSSPLPFESEVSNMRNEKFSESIGTVDHDDSGCSWTEVHPIKKRRKCAKRRLSRSSSASSLDTLASTKKGYETRTVIYMAAILDDNIPILSSLKLSQALEQQHREFILEMRYNTPLNIIAVKTVKQLELNFHGQAFTKYLIERKDTSLRLQHCV